MKIEGRMNARTSTLLAALEPVSFNTSTNSVNRMAFWAVWARPWVSHRVANRGWSSRERESAISSMCGGS